MTRDALPAPVKVAAFFDVDNTVVRGASAFHIARGLRERGFFRTKDILRFGWEQLKYLVFGESKEQMALLKGEALSIIRGWSVAEMAVISEDIYDEFLAMRIFPGTKALIDEHRAQGHEVWFVTATPVEVGRLIARRLGATGALGTVAEHKGGHYTGALVGEFMHGEAKADGVRELTTRLGIEPRHCFAYGDSMNDAPMLSAVGHPCAINPDARLRRLAKKNGWPIQDFRGRNPHGRRSIVRASLTGFVWVLLKIVRTVGHQILRPIRALRRRPSAD